MLLMVCFLLSFADGFIVYEYGGDIRLVMRLMKKKDEHNPDPKPNPSSGIYQFAEYILAYIDNKNNIVK